MADELDYYKSRLDELTGQVIRSDSVVSRAKRELGQRRKALSILSELQGRVRADTPSAEAVRIALTATGAAMKMDRAVLLKSVGGGRFVASESVGYSAGDDPRGRELELGEGFREKVRLVTAAVAEDAAGAEVREKLRLRYFVSVPVVVGARCEGVIVSGRLREAKPFYPPLDEGDVSTWQATASFLGSSLLNSELFARVKRMADSFARFVPREFLDLLGREEMTDVEIGDQRRMEMTVLFSDIRGFTTLSEKMSPEETFRFVNGYLAHAAPVIRRNGGFIDKYIGDAIMALFPGKAEDAIRAGLELQASVAAFNESGQMPGVPGSAARVGVGVGVHTGWVMLGTTGFEDRLDCTVISDAVNLASRLEGLTKYYGSDLIVSAETLGRVPVGSRPAHRVVDRVRVKGKRDPVEIIDVYAGNAPIIRALKHGTRHGFAAGLAAYGRGELDAADVLFADVIERNESDLAARVLAGRVAKFREEGLPDHWDGVVALDVK